MQLREHLAEGGSPQFFAADGQAIPAHFHVTELGEVTRHFIDCGGKVRLEKKANLQLWTSVDTDHRLAAERFLKIVDVARERLGLGDLAITVEYQGERTIETYELALDDARRLTLQPVQTACLAEELCGIPAQVARPLIQLAEATDCCTPGGGCC